ncbi:MAG: YgaP family membrane protein [Alphaproteobacteria bacterium]
MFKTANVGSVDRIIRLVVGAVFIILPFISTSPLWSGALMIWLLPIIGIVLIATAFFRFCPLYKILGVKTCKAG